MTNTFLISEVKLREYTDLDNNIDTALIKNAIREAQDIRLQSIIGTLLYEKIMDLVDSGDISLSENAKYKTILDNYIQDYLIYAAYWYSLDAIYLRSRNNGLIQPNGGENSDAVDRSLYNLKRQSVEKKMEFYAEKLTEYIIEENTQYPELNDSNKLYEQQPDYTNKYGSPFVFGRQGKTAEAFVKRGYRVYDSSRKQYPQ